MPGGFQKDQRLRRAPERRAEGVDLAVLGRGKSGEGIIPIGSRSIQDRSLLCNSADWSCRPTSCLPTSNCSHDPTWHRPEKSKKSPPRLGLAGATFVDLEHPLDCLPLSLALVSKRSRVQSEPSATPRNMPRPPHACVTLLTSDSYLAGALVTLASLQDTEPDHAAYDTVCLVTPATLGHAAIQAVQKRFDFVIGVEEITTSNWEELDLLGAGLCLSVFWLIRR